MNDTESSSSIVGTLKKLVVPILMSGTIAVIFVFAGDAYQAVGIAALDTTNQIISYALGIALFLSSAHLVNRVIESVLFDIVIARATGSPVPRLLKQVASFLVYLTAIAVILSVVFKKDLTVVWAASGIAGLVLGMALKELLSDMISGLALNIDRPIKIGDFILLHLGVFGTNPVDGQVLEISWRTTRIRDDRGAIVIIPNNKLAASTVTNLSAAETEFFESKQLVVIDSSVPPERVMRTLLAAATEACATLNPENGSPPSVEVRKLLAHGVEYGVKYYHRPWQFRKARSLINQGVLNHLRRAGLRLAIAKVEQYEADGKGWEPDWTGQGQIRACLLGCGLFQDLTAEQLAHLASRLVIRPAQIGAPLLLAGQAGDRAILVVEGLLEEARGRSGKTTATFLGAGDIYGVTAALLGDAYPGMLRARTPSLICEIALSDFEALFAAYPEAALPIARRLAATMARPSQDSTAALETDDLAIDVLRTLRRTFPGLPTR